MAHEFRPTEHQIELFGGTVTALLRYLQAVEEFVGASDGLALANRDVADALDAGPDLPEAVTKWPAVLRQLAESAEDRVVSLRDQTLDLAAMRDELARLVQGWT